MGRVSLYLWVFRHLWGKAKAREEYPVPAMAGDAEYALGKAIRANDPDGIANMLKGGQVLRVPLGTKVRVVEAPEVIDPSSFSKKLIITSRLPMDNHAHRVVRITEGDMKGRAVVIPARNLRPIGEPASKAEPEKARPKAADPSKRAATLLATGKNLEKLGKTSAALETYRRVAKDFAGTDQAKEATARIKALGGK